MTRGLHALEDFASRLLRDVARLDPCAAVEVGEQEVDGLTDYSPDGHQARADLAARALGELENLPATSPLHAHLAERLRTRIAFHDAGEDLRELHAAATGPLQLIRQSVEAAVPGRDAGARPTRMAGPVSARARPRSPQPWTGTPAASCSPPSAVTCRPGAKWSS